MIKLLTLNRQSFFNVLASMGLAIGLSAAAQLIGIYPKTVPSPNPESGQVTNLSSLDVEDTKGISHTQQRQQNSPKINTQVVKASSAKLLDQKSDPALPTAYPLTQKVTPSSGFGIRSDPFTHYLGNHFGIDLPAAMGSPILASAAGKVIAAGYDGGYGNQVTIDHGNGYTTKYAHADRLLVRLGDRIEQHQQIALVGSTGRSTGPHLHYEISYHQQPIDPRNFIAVQFADMPVGKTGPRTVVADGNSMGNTSARVIGNGNWQENRKQGFRQFDPTASYQSPKPRIEKSYYAYGEMVASVRVRSGKQVQ